MNNWRLNLELAGRDDPLQRKPPIRFPDIVVDAHYAVSGRGEDAFLYPDRATGVTSPYLDPRTGEREASWPTRNLTEDEISGMLQAFVPLADARSTNRFVDFANRFGGLSLCDQHGLPFAHEDNDDCQLRYSEKISHWRNLAKMVRSALNIASVLQRSDTSPEQPPQLGSDADWRVLDPLIHDEVLADQDLPEAKAWLAYYVSNFLAWTGASVQLLWEEPTPQVQIAAWSSFAHIALQLMYFIPGGAQFATCHECRDLYLPKRKPRADQNNYCRVCRGKGVPDRDSKRRRRAQPD